MNKKKWTVLWGVLACAVAAAATGLHETFDSFLLREVPLHEVVRLVSGASGAPVVCTPEAAKKEVSLSFSNVSLEAGLQAMCRSHDLWMSVSPEGVVVITTLEQHIDSESIYSNDYMESIPIKYPSVNDVADTLKGLFRDRIVWERIDETSEDPIGGIERALNRMDLLVGRSQFEIMRTRKPSISDAEAAHFSDGEDLHQIETLQARSNFIKKFRRECAGVGAMGGSERLSLIYLSALPEINTLLVRSNDRNAVQRVKQAVETLDKPRGQVLLQVQVLSVTLDDSVQTGVEWLFENEPVSAGFADSLIRPLTETAAGSAPIVNSDFLSGTPLVSFVNETVRARLTAFAKREDVHEVAAPVLLVTDNEAANVFVGKNSKFLEGYTVKEVKDKETGFVTDVKVDPNFVRRNIGFSLLVTPRIHADRTVTLRIVNEHSAVSDLPREIDIPLETDSFKTYDVEQEVVTSTLVAKDNSLVVLGGLISESTVAENHGLPLLKDLPFFGRLFSVQNDKKVREELMVLIRPRVIAVPGEGEEVAGKALRDLNLSPDEMRSLHSHLGEPKS